MTSDTTQDRPAAAETGPLPDLIAPARVVLWGFDGPICSLFGRHPAERLATDLVGWLERRGLRGLLTEAERDGLCPRAVLRAVGRRHPGGDVVAELDERLAAEEVRAAASAMPTAYADPLIRTWTAVGVRMAVVTDNSPRAVLAYLTSRGVLPCFGPHIYGRTPDHGLLKLHPHGIHRALGAMGAAPSEALVIGGAPSDCAAAAETGVPFLGYARGERGAASLRAAGADVVVRSLEPLLGVIRRGPAPGQAPARRAGA
ncbi:HAD family hydrolase [Streptomyces sp. SID5643]|uniref:HAD family hydrolase n=1 Tax=Streptomyces sp. SID5643 TaxID=2690307 RepID=UPI0031FE454B